MNEVLRINRGDIGSISVSPFEPPSPIFIGSIEGLKYNMRREVGRRHTQGIIDSQQGAQDDPNIFNKDLKILGLFEVAESYSHIGVTDSKSGFKLMPEDKVIHLGLLPIEFSQNRMVLRRKEILEKAVHSLGLISKYIKTHNLQANYIVGITYDTMAKIATQLGFEIADGQVILPENLRNKLEQQYNVMTPRGWRGRPLGDLRVIYQSREDFLDRWGSQES